MNEDTKWFNAAIQINRQIVRIETPNGFGTGFISHAADDLRGVATALHVVADAVEKNLTVTIRHGNEKPICVQAGSEDEVILIRSKLSDRDSALLLFANASSLPEPQVKIIESDAKLVPSTHVAWMGFPEFYKDHACYFSGRISAVFDDGSGYFIDSGSPPGTSGGPVFYISKDRPVIVGSISGYRYPTKTQEIRDDKTVSFHVIPLPGMAVANDISLVSKFDIVKAPDTRPLSERIVRQ